MIIFELMISSALVTLIWIIQLLHYPSFLYVDKNQFVQFHAFHTKWITFLVMPLMILEVLFCFAQFNLILFFIILLVWLSTFFIQVPCHNKLKSGFEESIIQRLIFSNWIRTILWTLKLFVLLIIRPW